MLDTDIYYTKVLSAGKIIADTDLMLNRYQQIFPFIFTNTFFNLDSISFNEGKELNFEWSINQLEHKRLLNN